MNKKLRFYFILHVFFISDTKFSTKICQSGAIKAIYPILKHLSGKVGNLYPVLQVRTFDYRISANSFRGNYSFLNLALCTVTFDLYFINLNSCRGNYSREETIQGRKLFAEIRYLVEKFRRFILGKFVKTCHELDHWRVDFVVNHCIYGNRYAVFSKDLLGRYIKRYGPQVTYHNLNILEKLWYFVTKIVLTYCEKKLFQ